MSPKKSPIVPPDQIQESIYIIRGEKVMLDDGLAELYGMTTSGLNKAVSRSLDRFPEDFMFRISKQEFKNLRFQSGISRDWGGRRYPPRAFTEQGVAMLSSVLHNKRAIQVNVQIMRAFVQMREFMLTHWDLARKLKELEKKHLKHEKQFAVVFQAPLPWSL